MSADKKLMKKFRKPNPSHTMLTATREIKNIPLEGELEVSGETPLSGVFYVPEVKHTLLATHHTLDTWNATAVSTTQGMVDVRGQVMYDEDKVITRGIRRVFIGHHWEWTQRNCET
jgi:hypothetical protein